MNNLKRFHVPPAPVDFMDIRIDYGGVAAWDIANNCAYHNRLRGVTNFWNHLTRKGFHFLCSFLRNAHSINLLKQFKH